MLGCLGFLFFWVLRVYFLSLFHVLVSFLYTFCMLRDAFTHFINFFGYLSKKKKKKLQAFFQFGLPPFT
jgi:hypothetical protein